MYEIFHIVPISATEDAIYKALVEQKKLRKWWLPGASTSGEIESIASFPLSSGKANIKMKIINLNPQKEVSWECVNHLHKDWIGTKVEFLIIKKNEGCELHFKHTGWKKVTGVYGKVSYYWASIYLTQLKKQLEENII